MQARETLLELVRRHVREGEEHLRRQEALVQELTSERSPLLGASIAFLRDLRGYQAMHTTHLSQIEEEVRNGVRDVSGNLRPRR